MSDTPPVSRVVLGTWSDRVQAEYATGAAASQLALWLMQIAAPPELVRAALDVVSEEIDHAARSFEVCRRAGLLAPRPVDRAMLGLPRDDDAPLEHDIVRGCLRVFCLGEAYAVEILREMRKVCTFAPAREAIEQLLADEVAHRGFGFELLGWLVEHDGSGDLRALVHAELPRLVDELRCTFGSPGGVEVGPIEEAWGVVGRPVYAAVLERVVATVLPKQLAAVGLAAR
ncbi:MAG TPA: ferritin-like domain-containing protein [Nannocystaceae bacterium]|nr:ferritin-like domain-containing protein [Nannocystaceae bacterium]